MLKVCVDRGYALECLERCEDCLLEVNPTLKEFPKPSLMVFSCDFCGMDCFSPFSSSGCAHFQGTSSFSYLGLLVE